MMESIGMAQQQLLSALELPFICKDLSQTWTESVPVWYPHAVLDNSRLAVAEQLLQAGLYEAAVQELCSLESVCARAKAGQLFLALGQMIDLQSLPPTQPRLTDSSRKRLDHYIRWVRRDISSIMKDPSTNVLAASGAQPPPGGLYSVR